MPATIDSALGVEARYKNVNYATPQAWLGSTEVAAPPNNPQALIMLAKKPIEAYMYPI